MTGTTRKPGWFDTRWTPSEICEMAGAFNHRSEVEYHDALDRLEQERRKFIEKITDDPSWKSVFTLDHMCQAHFEQYLTFDINF